MRNTRYRTRRIGLALLLSANAWWCAAQAAESAPPEIAVLQAPAGAPNVLVVLLDDVGFGAASTFGGAIDTPALAALADGGLRYNRFHTTAICSPTRASLLTGRDAHVTGVGTVMNTANSYPGYTGVLKKETATIARILRGNGYNTAAFGKWHLAPDWESSPSGPFDHWPTGVGFEKFYGFLGGETDQFEPTLYEGTTPLLRPAGSDYHLTEDLATQAVRWLRLQHSVTPDKPFFLYFAPGATHAPHQAPAAWIEPYRGKFDSGWDAMREAIFARQKAQGVIPSDALLTPRPDLLPAWEQLSADERIVAARMMEVYAGFLAHTDAQIGRLVQALKDSGQFDDTLIFYIVGDNGGSGEGGLLGAVNYMGTLQGLPEPVARKLSRIDDFGGPDSYLNYPAGWAWAMSTPFQWMKQFASHLGGTRNPMVVSWPAGIREQGGLRSQFGHVNDIVPTILEVAHIEAPVSVDGIKQLPMDGTSLVASFACADAPEKHRTQYFEIFGNRAIYHDGWMASAFHGHVPWTIGQRDKGRNFAEDSWELYHLDEDFSQARDLATQQPAKLAALRKLFDSEAARVGILPLRDAAGTRTPMPSLNADRTRFRYYPGAIGIPEKEAPPILNRSWSLTAELELPASGARGVIATEGGTGAGWSLYLDGEGKPVFEYRLFEVSRVRIAAQQSLAAGMHRLQVDFDYDGEGYAKGGTLRLLVDGQEQGTARLPATPPAFFSIDETFDVGVDTGSPAGAYAFGNPLTEGVLGSVEVELR
ncbi:MAG: arylsulfatase [Pseudomonadales bacterium]|nr:arylsulfatase [Pseudomonadales bacterium]